MKTKQQHLENYQKWYIIGRAFPWRWLWINVVLVFIVTMLTVAQVIEPPLWVGLTIAIVIGTMFSWLSVINTKQDVIDRKDIVCRKRTNVRNKITSLEREVSTAQALFMQNTKDIDPCDFTQEHITLFKKYKNLQNKLYKKQAYLQMIGG
jgi:hypothetical protein